MPHGTACTRVGDGVGRGGGIPDAEAGELHHLRTGQTSTTGTAGLTTGLRIPVTVVGGAWPNWPSSQATDKRSPGYESGRVAPGNRALVVTDQTAHAIGTSDRTRRVRIRNSDETVIAYQAAY